MWTKCAEITPHAQLVRFPINCPCADVLTIFMLPWLQAGRMPLHVAAIAGSKQNVSALFEASMKTDQGKLKMEEAIKSSVAKARVLILQLLLSH